MTKSTESKVWRFWVSKYISRVKGFAPWSLVKEGREEKVLKAFENWPGENDQKVVAPKGIRP